MIQPRIHSERATWVRNRLTRLFIVAGVIGSILSMLVITLDGFLRSGYSPLYQMISDLGVGKNAWLLNSDLVVSGLLIMLFAIGFSQAMRNSISGRRLVASTSLFLLAGAGIANDGFFTEYNVADPHAALHDALHTLGFFVAFISLGIAFFLIGLQLRNDRARRGYGWYSLITGLVMLSLILLPYAFPVHGMQLEGLNERMILVAAIAWQVVTGYRLSALEKL
jgi:hypothetical membrane protein